MKKISIKIAIVMLFIFVMIPVISFIINLNTYKNKRSDMVGVIKEMSRDSVKVLVLEGVKSSKGMLYVQNGWKTTNLIDLNIMPEEISICNDTMKIVLNDNSDVYQGSIFLANLKIVFRNEDSGEELKSY